MDTLRPTSRNGLDALDYNDFTVRTVFSFGFSVALVVAFCVLVGSMIRPLPKYGPPDNPEEFEPLPLDPPGTSGRSGQIRRIHRPKSFESRMQSTGNAELAAAETHADIHFHWPSNMKQGESAEVSLEIGKPELLKLEDEARRMASEQLTKLHEALMTVSMKGYLATDSGLECRIVGNDKGEFSTLSGHGLVQWIITAKTTGNHLIAWNLTAILKTQYGPFEQPLRSGNEHTNVDFSWAYFFRQLRDLKAVDGIYLLIGGLTVAVWKWLRKKFGGTIPQPVGTKEPETDVE